ncbi:Pilus assembly protein, PilO [uncultured Desulfobacterium sp.]|uniref:Pilus assembly protein, PilO n=1 Tax=uncultured Desulfobacterium sp. TaxID=201089 RepID=A0A445MX50_9BACT|nr:Pilus assembly protein, PilO [uncultured Desulfobacterium sp.]
MDTTEIIEKIEKIKMIYRVLIFVGTLLLLGGLFYWLVYSPKCKEIAAIENQNASISSKIIEAKQKTKDLPKFKEDVAQVEAQYKEALTLLPKTEEIPTLLRNITELGATSNLEFNSFSPSTGQSQKMYTEIPISIQVKGKYHDVLLFFDRVGKMKRIVTIENVTMAPSGGETTLNVSCRAMTYKFKE